MVSLVDLYSCGKIVRYFMKRKKKAIKNNSNSKIWWAIKILQNKWLEIVVQKMVRNIQSHCPIMGIDVVDFVK